MADVKSHYDDCIAPYYSWMCGGAEVKFEENKTFFKSCGIYPTLSRIALDLGAGSGFQSIPLAKTGFKVIAIDLSRNMLAQLKSNAEGLPIEAIEDDILNFAEHLQNKIELIVCMGDTLTHLQTFEEVQRLIEGACRALEKNGHMILSFRDLTAELKALDRFIPVRNDSKNIFTCFLEYRKTHVKVHDIIYEKVGTRWVLKKSCFQKLRLSPQRIHEGLLKAGFTIESESIDNGMISIIARNPGA